jgi:hypothetical protein
MSDPNDSTSTGDGDCVPLSSIFLEFCNKLRNNDPTILPKPGEPFRMRIRDLSENEQMEIADALMENSNVTYLELTTAKYTKSSAEAMAKYVRTSKCLQRIGVWIMDDRALKQREERLCCFLHAIQESTSLKELVMRLPPLGEASNLAFVNMLTHTQSLQSLSLTGPSAVPPV